ncbi:MAG: dipeptide epimerase [Gammaproteobacteria bacterium]|nr:dipeptide epimerase [Gammaproteobacteria bacterium]
MRAIARSETWAVRGGFRISRGASTLSHVLHVRIEAHSIRAQGEAEAAEFNIDEAAACVARCRDFLATLEPSYTRERLQHDLPRGPIRNAIDCALWDLEAKRSGRRAWELAGIDPAPVRTLYTLSLDTPAVMAEAARTHAHWPWLKLKLGADGDIERVQAVRAAAPQAKLLVDANGGWNLAQLNHYAPLLADLGVSVIEQPLPTGNDRALDGYSGQLPICADESCTDRASLDTLPATYRFINIKLDKTGGLSEALALAERARTRGLGVMVGCNLGTSLAIAPALLIARHADVVDLDSPLLLAGDREPALRFETDLVHWPESALWG